MRRRRSAQADRPARRRSRLRLSSSHLTAVFGKLRGRWKRPARLTRSSARRKLTGPEHACWGPPPSKRWRHDAGNRRAMVDGEMWHSVSGFSIGHFARQNAARARGSSLLDLQDHGHSGQMTLCGDCRWPRLRRESRCGLRSTPSALPSLGKNIVERIREPLADSLVERCATLGTWLEIRLPCRFGFGAIRRRHPLRRS